ncbi:MAG: signal transduction protein [Desulfobulbaceae bacterium BRH_c16a]|nr:MAG: signal transduction protein [Desulfobulbaceae bacterium BRH_c16a]
MSTAQIFVEKFKDIHPLPHVVTTLSRLIADSESTMKDFEEVIKIDPILVSRLLRLVNSPFYGLAQTVDSIGRAVAFLGMKNLHNLVVADALKNIFISRDTNAIFSKKRLWLHCAAVSICSKMVAERIFGINGDDAFLCGILHDFGLLVEEQVETNKFQRICTTCDSTSLLIDMERQAFATDHCEICYIMTLDWNMPLTIQEAIRDHHLLSDTIVPSSLAGIIQISEYIASQLGHSTLPNMATQISPPLLEHLQVNIDEYNVLIEDIPEEMAKAQAIYG